MLQCTLADRSMDLDEEEVAGLMWVLYRRLYENSKWYQQLRLCP